MEKVASGVNDFGIRLHKLLGLGNEEQNFCVSPYSVFSSLTVIYLGARGQTALQIAEVLGFRNKQTSKIHEICAWMGFLLQESGSKNNELFMANQLFIHGDIDIRMDYDQWAKEYYNTIPVSMSFATHPQGSRRRINQWTQKKMNGNVKELIPENWIDDKRIIMSVNVAYFNGLWIGNFPECNTYKGQFFCSGETSIEVDMLYKEDNLYYGEFPDMQCYALLLPVAFAKGFVTILLPYENQNIATVEYLLQGYNFKNFRKYAKRKEVSVHLPKFRLENSYELSAALASLGIEDLVLPGQTDLSAMLECPPVETTMTDFIHKACIEVGEVGLPPAKPRSSLKCVTKALDRVEMMVNRPFLFFVQDGISHAIIFSGHVAKPISPEPVEEILLHDGDIAL